ncbi:MAG: response regulator [Ignavibacteriales bacterium]|nr:response regulator [Ignavibacteriales bacterium]
MSDLSSATILIVDDSPENIDILGAALVEYKKLIALNGEKAIKILQDKKPDLILLDVVMPGISGYDVIKLLKENEATKDIPVIFITSLSEAQDEAKGVELGAADYITKPFKTEIVKARVKTQLLLKQQQESLWQLNKALMEQNEIIESEQEKSQLLLKNIFPAKVIEDLKKYGKTDPQVYDEVSILFLDIVGFTKLASQIQPIDLIAELNEIFTKFDEIVDTYSCERIKTIGDSYMAVCGIAYPNDKHARLLMSSAIEFISFMKYRNQNLKSGQHRFEIRVGINSGSVIGGVVGTRKYIYDIFGDAVNVASRMESNSEPMRIAISERTFPLLKDFYDFEEKGVVSVKGIGEMKIYFLSDKYFKYV